MTIDSVSKELNPNSATIVIFGATGDLTARKLMPALYALWKNGFLSGRASIVGVGRRAKTNAEFRDEMFTAVSEHSRCGEIKASDWTSFHRRCFIASLTF